MRKRPCDTYIQVLRTRSSFHTNEKGQPCFVARNPFRHEASWSKDYSFLKPCKIITAYGKGGDLTLCKLLKILPVLARICVCSVFEVKSESEKNHTVQSSSPSAITGSAGPSPLFDLWIQWSLFQSPQQRVPGDNFPHHPTSVVEWTAHVHSVAIYVVAQDTIVHMNIGLKMGLMDRRLKRLLRMDPCRGYWPLPHPAYRFYIGNFLRGNFDRSPEWTFV